MRITALALLGLALAPACATEPETATVELGATVGSFERSSCSTSVVINLSLQIADEVNCMMPGQLVRFEASEKIRFASSAVLPYLAQEGVDKLQQVAQGATLTINSAFRTVVQQYLLRRWKELGRCGITAAATPGRSNHESGRALDIDNYSAVRLRMRSFGWVDNVPGDPVHFEYLAAPDIRGADVLAFQRLWNRNNPGDMISEDGDYGPMTAAKLAAAPAQGFAKGAMCGPPTPPPPPPVDEPPPDTGEGEGEDPDEMKDDNGCNTGSQHGVAMIALALGFMRRKRCASAR